MKRHLTKLLPTKHPLTKQQRTILEAILFFLEQGELPTVREVGALVGLRSPATVLKHLRALEREKLISLSGKSRGIRIVARELVEGETAPQETTQPPWQFTPQLTPRSPLRFLSPIPFSKPFSKQGVPLAGAIPLVGAIAAGKPFESYSDGFLTSHHLDGHLDELAPNEVETPQTEILQPEIPIDPQVFVESGELFALRVEGDSMVNAGILNGDYVIIRRQNSVEEGEIAAVLINGEGTLKRWYAQKIATEGSEKKRVSLEPANERFDPIVITEDDAKDVLVFGKYVGLVRGNLRNLRIS
jgi:SOS-response transcriptional repressor LexA